jgi:hypothetical protein
MTIIDGSVGDQTITITIGFVSNRKGHGQYNLITATLRRFPFVQAPIPVPPPTFWPTANRKS